MAGGGDWLWVRGLCVWGECHDEGSGVAGWSGMRSGVVDPVFPF